MRLGLLLITLGALFLFGCDKAPEAGKQNAKPPYASYKEIPGVTSEEIDAIEELRRQRKAFVYGSIQSTETFLDLFGNLEGFTDLYCEWLTELFGISFVPKHFIWGDLLGKLKSFEVDFTGDITPDEERQKIYFMTDAIAMRTVRYYRLADRESISGIEKERPLRYAFMHGTTTANDVIPHLKPGSYEIVYSNDINAIYKALKNNEIDAFFSECVAETTFDGYGDVVAYDFLPLTYNPVSLTTQNPSLQPVISVMQKALQDNITTNYLAALHKLGRREYRKHKLYTMLTEEERAYIRNNPVIPIVAEHYNYPISFYNKYEKEWQGIFFDVLKEMRELTGLSFKLINDHKTEWPDLQNLLEEGKAFMVNELIPTEERRAKGFLWPNIPTMLDNYALLSKSEFPNISLRDVPTVKVGLPLGTAYAEMFEKWFPNHPKTVDYESSDEAFSALELDEIDMVISSQRRLLAITNYHEYPGYKANLVFDKTAESYFGFNKNHATLNSIFSKALLVIDIKAISEQWSLKTYDYKGKIAQAQRPWLIGASVLLLCVLVLVVFVFMRERDTGKQKLRAAVARAETANRAKSMFLAKMSHEIRTPMNAIIGMAEIALRKDISNNAREDIVTIKRAGINLLSIINDILDFSKIESGKLEIVPRGYYFSSLINDVTSIIKTRLIDSKVRFDINVDSGIPNALFGDETRLRQVLLNLLSNAVKYTRKGFISFSVNGKIINESEGSTIILTVEITDSGIGIKKDDIGKLFGDYVQVNLKTNKNIEGTGLGLAITKSLIEAMNGDIKVISEYGKGSTFTVNLPQKIRYMEPLAVLEALEDNANFIIKFNAPNARVLVIDDIDTNLKIAEGLLEPYRIQVDTAMSGREAIDKIAACNYDLVFMDHMMPEMDGVEATNHIRKNISKDLPIVALTANAVSGIREMFIKNGFNDFLSKPIDIVKLNAVLEKWIPKEKQTEAQEIPHKESDLNMDIEIEGVNVKKAIAASGGTLKSYLRTLAVFYKDGNKKIEGIKKSMAAEDYPLYTIHVHALKSASANVGAYEISEAAKALEMAGKSMDLEFIKSHNECFLNDLQAVLGKIGVVVLANAESEQSSETLEDNLIELKKALETLSSPAINKSINKLQNYEQASDIMQSVLVGNYDEAIAMINVRLTPSASLSNTVQESGSQP